MNTDVPAYLAATHSVVWTGRHRARLLNTPERRAAHAALLAKIEKRRLPRPALRDRGGSLYRHPVYGFKLHLPEHIVMTYTGGEAQHIAIGTVLLRVNHRTRTLHGPVPDSWLVDLNAGPIVDEGAQMVEQQEELLAA